MLFYNKNCIFNNEKKIKHFFAKILSDFNERCIIAQKRIVHEHGKS